MSKSEISPPTLADIDEMARAALASLPEPMAQMTKGVVLQVTEFPDDDVCAEMGLESPFDIMYANQSYGCQFCHSPAE